MRRRLVTLVLVSLMFTSTSVSVLGDVGRDVMDNWDDGDAWVEISLISWVANQTEEWDSSGGLPDPQFRICFDVDGEDLDCVNTPTWENQWELNATWNYTIDIPDTSNLLNITIECEDNDAFNDDECDMNADVNEWKLYAEYNWSQNPNMTISGNGDGDGNGTWKNAASVWEVKVFGFGDEDGDGVPDNIDLCSSTLQEEIVLEIKIGCSWGQMDADLDGVQNSNDSFPFSYNLNGSHTHGANYSGWLNNERRVELQEGFTQYWDQHTANLRFDPPNKWPQHSVRFDINQDGIYDSISIGDDYLYQQISTSPENYDGLFLEFDDFCIYTGEVSCSIEFYDFGQDGSMEMVTDTGIFTYSELNYSMVTSITHCGGRLAHDPQIQLEPTTGYDVILCPGKFNGYRVVYIDNYSVLSAFNFDSQNSESKSLDWWNRIGGLGDINSDGFIDLVRQNESKGCDVFLGSADGLSNQGIAVPSSNRYDCKGPLTLVDMDLNGEVDIVSSTSLIFQVDGSFSWIGYRGDEEPLIAKPIDWDGDGDLDIAYIERTASQDHHSSLYVSYNPSFIDTDSDGIEDSNDLCDATPSIEISDSNGCSPSQRDTDGDGINDATDVCPNTPSANTVNLEGCAPSQLDSDGDGINDALDLCPTTPNGESVNLNGCSQSEIDTDNDGVVNSNDACPGTAQGSVVDSNGCSESDIVDNDADGDGVVDTYDACPSTIAGSTVDQNGCSDAQLDIDGDGVANTRDQCPGTSSGAEVSYYGCSASQGDEDLDGVLNVDDDCPGSWFVDKDNPPETSNGCDGMLESQDDDDDGDGLVNTYDECPDTPSGQSVDNQGCTIAQRNAEADDTSSSGTIGDAIIGFLCCFGILGMVLSYSGRLVKKSSPPAKLVQAPQQVIHQQSVHQQQQVMRELENQRKKAEHQVAQLQQQLHQSNQMSAAQLASVQSQLSNMQQQVTATNMAKADIQRELEQMKAQEMERSTLTESPVNFQDSAVAGDSLVGSTKIENQTVNDADAIARAAAAAAIDAYRMGLNDRER